MRLTKIYMGKGKDETELSVPESIAPAVLTAIRGGPFCLYWVASLLFFLSCGLFSLGLWKVSELKSETETTKSSIDCKQLNKTCGTVAGDEGK